MKPPNWDGFASAEIGAPEVAPTEPVELSLLVGCAKCGRTHEQVQFRALHAPVVAADGTTWTHWSICPAKDEPILLAFRSTASVVVTT